MAKAEATVEELVGMLDRYGDGASLHAASRADELLDRGNMEGRAVWLRVQEAVLKLSKDAPGEREAVH